MKKQIRCKKDIDEAYRKAIKFSKFKKSESEKDTKARNKDQVILS